MVMMTTTMKTMVSLRANKKVYYVCLRVRSCVCDGCSRQAKKRNKENHITHVTFVNVLQLNSMFQRHSAWRQEAQRSNPNDKKLTIIKKRLKKGKKKQRRNHKCIFLMLTSIAIRVYNVFYLYLFVMSGNGIIRWRPEVNWHPCSMCGQRDLVKAQLTAAESVLLKCTQNACAYFAHRSGKRAYTSVVSPPLTSLCWSFNQPESYSCWQM